MKSFSNLPNRLYSFIEENEPLLLRNAVSTALFYSSLTIGQSFLAMSPFLRLHATFVPASIAFRLALVCGAAGVTQQQTTPLLNTLMNERKRGLSLKEKVRRGMLTVSAFVVLEQLAHPLVSPLRTALPSSISTTGSFAPLVGGSIPSSSISTTPYQRTLIQSMGKARGCHHCGSRQLFNRSPNSFFIADHMPPTKIASQLNNRLWRRMLKMPVVQCLRPQCFSCFNVQGQAVKKGIHVPVFQRNPRLVIFAPALGAWLLENETFGKRVRRWTNPIVDAIMSEVEDFDKEVMDGKLLNTRGNRKRKD